MTHQLDLRLNQHSEGKVFSTKNMLPLHIVHVELCGSRLEARRLEKFFKSGYGREIIKEILEEHADVVEWQTRKV